ncbi:MAG: mechanosensitive ion channel family protein [Treponema sp.]|jgi:small conductance mechanosensitive channel|nr:mechanosensitive ion channel family protein [Treponema sp.]
MKEKLIELWNNHSGDFFNLGKNIIIALFILIAGKIIMTIARKLINRTTGGAIKLDKNLVSILNIVITYGIIIICIIMILDLFGVNTASLIALLGAAGVAVGFALKDTLSNIAAGIILLVLHPYTKGDFIEVGSVVGSVQEMNLFTTILETADGVFISAPNSCIWGNSLKNYSRNARRRLDITVGISYGDSLDTAFAVMQDIIARETRFLADPAPQVMVQSLGDSSVNIMLRVWVPGNLYWAVYWEQMRNVKERIEEAGLVIPFPQRDIHLVKSGE